MDEAQGEAEAVEFDPTDLSPKAQEARKIHAARAMAAAGVESLSELHPLFGQEVTVREVDEEGSPLECTGVIDYCIGDRFRVRLPSGRQPWGNVHRLVRAKDGALSWEVQEIIHPTPDGSAVSTTGEG